MTKTELNARVASVINETRDALQLLWNNINKGQRKQLINLPEIKALLDRYGVNYEI